MLRAAARARIEEWIFVCEIVEAALGDDLENRQREVAENPDGQLASRNEFLDEKFVIVLRAVLQSAMRSRDPSSQCKRRRSSPGAAL